MWSPHHMTTTSHLWPFPFIQVYLFLFFIRTQSCWIRVNLMEVWYYLNLMSCEKSLFLIKALHIKGREDGIISRTLVCFMWYHFSLLFRLIMEKTQCGNENITIKRYTHAVCWEDTVGGPGPTSPGRLSGRQSMSLNTDGSESDKRHKGWHFRKSKWMSEQVQGPWSAFCWDS